ncbi:MAG: hypothetical protein ACTSYB_18555 [Candidatus Helarchaeota archaeon]
MVNIENVEDTKKYITELIKEVEKMGCDNKKISELKEILEEIGGYKRLYSKYEDIYSEAADALMLAGISAEDCKCDPLRKHIPLDKKTKIL